MLLFVCIMCVEVKMNNFREKIYRLQLRHINEIIELQSCFLAELRNSKKPCPIEFIEKAEMKLLMYEENKQKIIEKYIGETEYLDTICDSITGFKG